MTQRTESTEVSLVLRTLRLLIGQVENPIVKTCLQDACADILHLTSENDEAADGTPSCL